MGEVRHVLPQGAGRGGRAARTPAGRGRGGGGRGSANPEPGSYIRRNTPAVAGKLLSLVQIGGRELQDLLMSVVVVAGHRLPVHLPPHHAIGTHSLRAIRLYPQPSSDILAKGQVIVHGRLGVVTVSMGEGTYVAGDAHGRSRPGEPMVLQV